MMMIYECCCQKYSDGPGYRNTKVIVTFLISFTAVILVVPGKSGLVEIVASYVRTMRGTEFSLNLSLAHMMSFVGLFATTPTPSADS